MIRLFLVNEVGKISNDTDTTRFANGAITAAEFYKNTLPPEDQKETMLTRAMPFVGVVSPEIAQTLTLLQAC